MYSMLLLEKTTPVFNENNLFMATSDHIGYQGQVQSPHSIELQI